jgi:hypothetical protein
MGSKGGCGSTPATTPDSDESCINDIDIPATRAFGRRRSISRHKNLISRCVDDSAQDRRAHSRVGSGSPFQKDGLQQNDSRIGTDMDTVSPLQPPRKRRKPIPAKGHSKAQLRHHGRRRISPTPSIKDSERSSYALSDEDDDKQPSPSRTYRPRLNPGSPSSILVTEGVTSETNTEYREWPLQGFLKRINIGGQLSYTLEFTLPHNPLSIASPL